MKILLIGIFTLSSLGLFLNTDTIDSISTTLKTGNTVELSKYFMPTIDLTILDDDGVFSKAQASQMVKKFFTEHKPTGFSIVHKKEQYCIGNLTTSNQNFRVTFFLKNSGGKTLISQLLFEEED